MKIKQAAQRMGHCEFDLFRQAYAACHPGVSPNDAMLGEVFEAYAADGVTPLWVSHYIKAVLANSDPVQAVA